MPCGFLIFYVAFLRKKKENVKSAFDCFAPSTGSFVTACWSLRIQFVSLSMQATALDPVWTEKW